MCRQGVESHMCASAKERHHPHPTPPYPMWFMPKVTLFYAQSDPSNVGASIYAQSDSLLCPK